MRASTRSFENILVAWIRYTVRLLGQWCAAGQKLRTIQSCLTLQVCTWLHATRQHQLFVAGKAPHLATTVATTTGSKASRLLSRLAAVSGAGWWPRICVGPLEPELPYWREHYECDLCEVGRSGPGLTTRARRSARAWARVVLLRTAASTRWQV